MSEEGYIEKRQMATKAGRWMPPGGSVSWGPAEIWMAHMAFGLQAQISTALNLHPRHISISPQPVADVAFPIPRVHIDIPPGWIAPGNLPVVLAAKGAPTQNDVEEGTRSVIARETRIATERFMAVVKLWARWVGATDPVS